MRSEASEPGRMKKTNLSPLNSGQNKPKQTDGFAVEGMFSWAVGVRPVGSSQPGFGGAPGGSGVGRGVAALRSPSRVPPLHPPISSRLHPPPHPPLPCSHFLPHSLTPLGKTGGHAWAGNIGPAALTSPGTRVHRAWWGTSGRAAPGPARPAALEDRTWPLWDPSLPTAPCPSLGSLRL